MNTIPDDEDVKALYPNPKEIYSRQAAVCEKIESFGVFNVLAMIETGATLAEVGKVVGLTGGSVTAYFTQIGKTGNPTEADKQKKRQALWLEAKKARAQYMAESTIEIADTVEPDRDAVAKANLRIATRKWMAASADPDEYGAKKDGPLVQITITEAFLQSLKADPNPRRPLPPVRESGDASPDAKHQGGGASPVRLLPAGK